MNDEIVKAVLDRSQGICENCYNAGEEFHHVIKGHGKRKQHETVESVVLLCRNCHRGTNGVHGKNGKKLDLNLKIRLQDKYYQQGYSEQQVRKMMGGRLYGNHEHNQGTI